MIAGLICLKCSLEMDDELFFKNIFTSSLAEKQTYIEKYTKLLNMSHAFAFNAEVKYAIVEGQRVIQPRKIIFNNFMLNYFNNFNCF